MRDGLMPGTVARVETVVTPAMTATLGGQPIHPVLATARMIEWMEWAGRSLILPYLEETEDAVGYQVDIVHTRSTQVGDTLVAYAQFQKRDGNRIITKVWAENSHGMVGSGTFVQVVLTKERLALLLQSPPSPPR
ncbi:thioesterase family protein [Sulfobacillus sp. hq2]|uniref:thioesterase family protein n=1 Tax=Sulfobacillus TaxID=28033 RepID=UPI000CD22FDC|nr:thioesterase [Sulfobacillus sp. hq2]POB11492.1 thioesterase [Sulfobacillus sp. hq2]